MALSSGYLFFRLEGGTTPSSFPFKGRDLGPLVRVDHRSIGLAGCLFSGLCEPPPLWPFSSGYLAGAPSGNLLKGPWGSPFFHLRDLGTLDRVHFMAVICPGPSDPAPTLIRRRVLFFCGHSYGMQRVYQQYPLFHHG